MRADIPETIDKEDIRKLPAIAFEGEIIVVEDDQAVDDAVKYLLQYDVLGFDTETRPSFKKGKTNQHQVALLQLFGGEKAFLFRLNKMQLSNALTGLLANPKVLKVGAAVHDDIKALKALNSFRDGGFVDVQNMATKLEIEVKSLRKLTAMFFHARLSKSQQLSNWEADELSESQAKYAATDAWISHELYYKLKAFM